MIPRYLLLAQRINQVSLSMPSVRPPVLRAETQAALVNYLEFRHVIRNVYSFDLRSNRVAELVQNLRSTFELCKRDLQAFTNFLTEVSKADQEED